LKNPEIAYRLGSQIGPRLNLTAAIRIHGCGLLSCARDWAAQPPAIALNK
jgi:hypothetical protein